MRKRKMGGSGFWIGFLVFVACLITLIASGSDRSGELPRARFDDASPLGGKGLRLTLEKLGYRVQKQLAPLQTMPSGAKFWLILDPQTRFTRAESKILLDWVRKGGTLLFCVNSNASYYGSDDSPGSEGVESLRTALSIAPENSWNFGFGSNANGYEDGLPVLSPLSLDAVSNYREGVKGASGSARQIKISRPSLEIGGAPGGSLLRLDIGTGRVFVLPDALLFTNFSLSKPDNAVLATNLLRVHALSGTVYFDERQHGEFARSTAPPTILDYLLKPPVSYAMLQLFLAGLLFWAFAGRRLGAPVPLPDRSPVTRASQFAGAMAALFSKVGRPEAAAAIIGTRFRRRLARRLGLSPAESDTILARRAQEIAGIPFDITDRLLLQSHAPAETVSQALRDAQEMEMVIRKLEGKN